MKKILGISFSCIVLMHVDVAIGAPKKEFNQEKLNAIYLRVFGKKQPVLLAEMIADLKLNNRSAGKIRLKTDTKKITQVQRNLLLTKLRKYLKKKFYRQLERGSVNKHWISSRELARVGITVSYNIMGLNAEINIKKSSMNRRMRSILSAYSGSTKIIPENLLEPANISAYLNLDSSITHQHHAKRNKTQLNLRATSTINIKGIVLENQFTFAVGQKNTLRRGYTRLVLDDPENKLRYKIGDVSTLGRNFQNYFQLGGIQISKEKIWSSNHEVRPQGNYSFILDSESEVKVYQDGKLRHTVRLAAGKHTLKEIRANLGNQIRLRILDNFGRLTFKTFNRFSDSRLLKPGYARYALTVGVPTKHKNIGIKYDTRQTIASGYYQVGLSENMTIGFDLQSDGKSHLIGADVIKATALGTLSVGVGYSRPNKGKLGHAIHLQLDSPQNRRNKKAINWSISAQRFSKSYQALQLSDNHSSSQDIKHELNLSLDKTLSKNMQANFNIRHTNYYDNKTSRYFNLGLSKQIGKRISLSIYGSHFKERGIKNNSISLSINVQLGKSASGRYRSINTRYDTHNQAVQTSYNIGAKGFYGRDSLNGSIHLQSQKNQKSLNANIRYRDPRFDFNASHRAYLDSFNRTRQTTQANLNTAIVFADGDFALSRRINDSFAILQRPQGLQYPMAASRGKNLFQRKSNNLHDLPKYYNALITPSSHAVIANLNSYRVQHISVDSAVLPEGLDLNATEFDVMPDYKSGYKVKVGGVSRASFKARLLDKQGKPLALEGGQLISINEIGKKEILFITDKNGVLNIPSIHQGKYKLEIFNYLSDKNYLVNIHKGIKEIKDIHIVY